ncbi:acyl carrier protein [Aequorivita lipolytica]|uniref:Acyl carrier protein n=1 Tax=Aequorivita lipolytica TaxID=153267 RepID=A0A5C6YLP7_9FLAO|nr:acyl carrier protein [Aequorivita lipolytica]TXD68269.1 acyl carrier protein [Aequorivita lipolytica]SRX53450.1 Polyketide biosynthesis acyl-carrier-protein AcpK [Aequorivita lipolytica]
MEKEEIFKLIMSISTEVLPELEGKDIPITDSLKDWGANSIDRAEIVLMTLESLSLNIPMVEVTTTRTIEELVDILHARL